MVARGDLGAQLPFENVPSIQVRRSGRCGCLDVAVLMWVPCCGCLAVVDVCERSRGSSMMPWHCLAGLMMHPLHACLPACLRWIAERAACLPLPALVPFPSRGAEGGCEAVPPDGQTCDHRQPPAAINAHPAHPHARRGEWQLAGISVSPAGGLLCCAVLCCAVLC